ncbi:MAG: formylmethanofuran dehydrogenase subunit C [Proteobacteria bacterium]|nr:formylmethanofuran dehydrogenase subunit C [Pseudomonadota bacterium]NOG59217.1 formylmethanofuran dehydrogenase subunit C [Pseudomonadota bacterium]
MSALTFTLKSKPKFNLDMSPITSDKLQNLTLDKIKKLKLAYGKEKVSVDSLFTVNGSDKNTIIINKSCEQLICIGKDMSMGNITVKGNVGDFLGQLMKDGNITVNGNAGSWTGNGMSGGRINVKGNVLDYTGAGLPGDAFGMTNGLINITGDAGDRVGDRMRRGIIVIQGKSGDYCGSRIHAGTIIVLDKVGQRPGESMRRGTIILAKKPAHISSTFKSCGNLKMQFLRLLFTQLSKIDDDFLFFSKYGPVAHRFSGDLARNGKGEILILKTMNKR